MTADHADELVSVAEAASALRVSRATVWRWIGQDRLRAYRVGPRRVRLRRADLRRAIVPVRQPPARATDHSPPSAEDRRAGYLVALRQFEQWHREDRQRLGESLLPASWQLIRESRDDRVRQILGDDD